jgi:CBS domain containing-hemolysin-like protein
MEIAALLKVVGWGAVALLVVGWLVVSFSEPGPRRGAVERWSATLLFTAFLCLFLSMLLRAWTNDSTVGLVAFGFLVALFATSWVVSLVKAIRASASGAERASGPDVIH